MRFTTYRVRRGDTLSSIAYAFSGRPDWMPILAANTNLVTHPNRLVAGWNLSIPIKTSRGFATISN